MKRDGCRSGLPAAMGPGRDGDVAPTDPVAGEQLAGTTGVLGGDDVGLAQDAQGAQRDVLHVADGRADDEEFAGHIFCEQIRRVRSRGLQRYKR